MIKFKCMYCGAKLKGVDRSFGKKVHCPKCGHVIRATNANVIKDKPGKPRYMWKKVSSAVDNFRKDPWTRKYQKQVSFLRRVFIPQFDELTIFLMSAITILLLLTNRNMRKSILDCAVSIELPSRELLVLAIALIFCILLSIYHVFSNRQKDPLEKVIMAYFAVGITSVSGICAGKYMLKESIGLEIIFPLWNLFNAVFILVLFYLKLDKDTLEDFVTDKDATSGQVLLGLGTLLVVFVFCQYVFKLYWAVTMSVCVAYATNFTLTSEHTAEVDEDDWE